MKSLRKDTTVEQLRDTIVEIDKVSKTARKHNKSLSGDNYYGNKFDKLKATLIQTRKELESAVESSRHSDLKQAVKLLEPHFELLINPATNPSERSSAKKQILFILHSQIEPVIKDTKIRKIPKTDVMNQVGSMHVPL